MEELVDLLEIPLAIELLLLELSNVRLTGVRPLPVNPSLPEVTVNNTTCFV